MVDLQIRVGVHVFWFWESKARFMGMFYFGALFYSNPKMKMGLVGMSQFTKPLGVCIFMVLEILNLL